MDTINIFLSVWKLFSVIQGLVCGGLVAAGILLSWMLRSNLHGETETEKEFARQHKISYYQIDQGHKILFFWLIRGKILHICGEYLEYQLQCRIGFFVWKIRFFLFDTYAWSAHAPVQLALRAQTSTRIRWQYTPPDEMLARLLQNRLSIYSSR